jgi:hypothetical protein
MKPNKKGDYTGFRWIMWLIIALILGVGLFAIIRAVMNFTKV